MIPKEAVIAGIPHDVVFEEEKKLKYALKKIGVENWQNRYSYWDIMDNKIYIAENIPKDLQEFLFCLEVLRAISYYIGDKLWENDNILRPYAALLRLFLKSYNYKPKDGVDDPKSKDTRRYIQ